MTIEWLLQTRVNESESSIAEAALWKTDLPVCKLEDGASPRRENHGSGIENHVVNSI